MVLALGFLAASLQGTHSFLDWAMLLAEGPGGFSQRGFPEQETSDLSSPEQGPGPGDSGAYEVC